MLHAANVPPPTYIYTVKGSLEIHLLGASEPLRLLPQRAAWIESSRSLLIADAHFGKTTHFRKAGIPVPHALFLKDLDNLQSLLNLTNPTEVLFLGDFFHDQSNSEWNQLLEFRSAFPGMHWMVIPGNHDKPTLKLLESAGWLAPSSYVNRGGMLLSHDQIPNAGAGVSGHIHPGMVLRGKGRQSLRLPCFAVLRKEWCILPAFGSFTGLEIIDPKAGTALYPLAGEEVIQLMN